MAGITITNIEILPNGKWRNTTPDYTVFNDHIQAGLHDCPTCKCSFCGEPSVFTMLCAVHKTDGRSCGLLYCKDCLQIEHNKAQLKEEHLSQTQ